MYMKHYNKSNKRAFTLVETMVATFLLLVILAATFMVLSTGRNTWWSSTTNIELHQELRKTEEWISKELHQGRRATLGITGDNNEIIDFDIPLSVSDAGVITWQGVQYYIEDNQLLREVDGNIKVLANNINSLAFAQDSSNPQKITVSVTASKKDKRGRLTNASIYFDIKLRN